MLRMEMNCRIKDVGYGFLLFGSTRVTVILLFTIVFALTEIKIIVMIFNQQIFQWGVSPKFVTHASPHFKHTSVVQINRGSKERFFGSNTCI